MNEADAIAELALLCAADQTPTLTTAELRIILNRARRPNRDGTTWADPAWVPTWNIRDAAYRAWLTKAGKAASRFDATTDGATFNRSQIAAACRAQAAEYKPRGVVAIQMRELDPDAFPG